jgi:hypothetical protein
MATSFLDPLFRELLGNCTDFLNEETMLQCLGRNIGIRIEHTPKFHCELAGEGIEYTWACSKGEFRRQPLASKRGISKFHELVQKCNGPDVITKDRVVRFACHSRAYICTYFHLDQLQSSQQEEAAPVADQLPSQQQQHLFQDIEHLQKKFKTHRCALTFDGKFLRAVIKEEEAT